MQASKHVGKPVTKLVGCLHPGGPHNMFTKNMFDVAEILMLSALFCLDNSQAVDLLAKHLAVDSISQAFTLPNTVQI